jgi:hypothetical protein
MSSLEVPAAALRVTGEPSRYDTRSESGNTVTRRFCGTCGSPIYSTNSGVPGLAFVRASSLDDPSLFRPEYVIWAASAASWDFIDPALRRFPKGRPPKS